jgi:transcriptional regulator with XRE-family HTH domain
VIVNQEQRDLLFAKRLVASGQARTVRDAAGFSRADVARAAGGQMTIGAIRLWERGARSPRGWKGAAYGAVLRELIASEAKAS